MVIVLRNAPFVITRESNSLPPGLDIYKLMLHDKF